MFPFSEAPKRLSSSANIAPFPSRDAAILRCSNTAASIQTGDEAHKSGRVSPTVSRVAFELRKVRVYIQTPIPFVEMEPCFPHNLGGLSWLPPTKPRGQTTIRPPAATDQHPVASPPGKGCKAGHQCPFYRPMRGTPSEVGDQIPASRSHPVSSLEFHGKSSRLRLTV